MAEPRPRGTPLPFAAVILIVLGLGLWGLSRVVASGGPYAYAPAAHAPYAVQLHQGSVYRIAVPGGSSAAARQGVSTSALRCSLVSGNAGTQVIGVSPDSTKATDQIGFFVSPLTGRVHVECAGLGTVFVAGDDAPFDTGGLLLVLATICLTIGLPLLLSVLRRRRAPAPLPVPDP